MSRIPSLQNWANLHSLNLDVSLGFALVFVVGMIGCLLGTLPHPAGGGRGSDGVLPPRAPVGFLGSD
jgi:uncharacterized membrane protein YbhN (UPF0104 family)